MRLETLNTFPSWRLASMVAVLMAAACGITAQCQESNIADGIGKAPMPEYIPGFFLSDAVHSHEKGEIELTLTIDSRQRIGSNAAMQIEYGVTDRLEICVEAPYGITAGEEAEDLPGWSSIRVGTLYQVMRSDRPFALSAGVMFEVPIRPGDEFGVQPTILLAKTFRKLQIHASALADVTEGKTELEYNVASVYPIKRLWFPTVELNGRREGRQNTFYMTPGLYRHLSHRAAIGIGIPLGVGPGVDRSVGVVAKMNWEFGGKR